MPRDIIDVDGIITLTSDATERLSAKAQQKADFLGFYFGLESTKKCKDYVYKLDFIDNINEDLVKVTFPSNDDMIIFIKPQDIEYIRGIKIDFVCNDIGGGEIKYVNPNVAQECGCGLSISVK